MQFVYLLATLFFATSYLSFFKIRKSGDRFGFLHPWGWPIGAFVWEDLFVFSVFGCIACCVTIISGDNRIGYLFLSVFWVVRSAGETLFFFLEQFIPEHKYSAIMTPQFSPLRKIFGNISEQKCFVIMQVLHQTVMVTSLVVTIYLLLNWHTIR